MFRLFIALAVVAGLAASGLPHGADARFVVNQLTGFGAKKASSDASSLTFEGQALGDGEGSTTESASVATGTAKAGDKIVVVIQHANWSGYSDLSTVTIDGNSATYAIRQSVGSQEATEIWFFDDTSGTVGGTVTVTFTTSTAEAFNSVSAYRLTGAATGAPGVTVTDGSSDTVATLSTNTSVGDFVIAGITSRTAADHNVTWVGLSEDYEAEEAGQNVSSASLLVTSASTPLTITATLSATQSRNVAGALAKWAAE